MLARAFDDDPFACWIWPPERRSPRALPRFYTWRVRSLIGQGETWTTDDHAGAAVWALPGSWRPSPVAQLDMLRIVPTIESARLGEVREGLELIDRAHPARPHLYLALLGTEPGRQRTGVGSALLEPVLARCDADGVPAYLESSKRRNIGFYERHGFEAIDEVRLPGGPAAYPMWREPRGDAATRPAP
jgi:GNAT superfamily N-acetyltransferase